MALEDRGFGKSQIYSAWHRPSSIHRFVGPLAARLLSMIDIDAALWIEYNDGDKEPIALIETAQDVGQWNKPATVLKALARRCKETRRCLPMSCFTR